MIRPSLWILMIGSAWLATACAKDDDAPAMHEVVAGAGMSGGAVGGIGGAAASSGASGASGATGGASGTSAGVSAASGGVSGAAGAGTGGGAGAMDAGNDSGNGNDAGANAGSDASVDPCAAALFCESFESYSTGNAPGGDWEAQTSGGAVSVVDDQRFAGSKSARFTTEASSGGKTAFIRLDSASVFPVPGNSYFGRMMFHLDSSPEAAVHWTFIQSGGTVPGQSYRALYRYGGQHPVTEGSAFVGNQLMANYETPDSYGGNGPSSDCWLHADKKVVPVGRWACVEWQLDGPNDTMRLWLDGDPIDDLTMIGVGQGCLHQDATYRWTAPSFADVSLGWESYQSDDARTLHIDDVVISTNRIGCPAAP